jgi:hypothetical protein
MANRAYLFSGEFKDPWAMDWDKRANSFIDSRHRIPLSWFFFFNKDDIVLLDVVYRNSWWLDIKFCCRKEDALIAFSKHQELLRQIVGDEFNSDLTKEFTQRITDWPGTHLYMVLEEVFDGTGRPDSDNCTNILELLASDNPSISALTDALGWYCKTQIIDQEEFKLDVLGRTTS